MQAAAAISSGAHARGLARRGRRRPGAGCGAVEVVDLAQGVFDPEVAAHKGGGLVKQLARGQAPLILLADRSSTGLQQDP